MRRIPVGRATALITSVLVATTLVAAPLSASAKDGDVIRRGDCTARSDWKLKLSPENGRIEVEFEVDQNRNGQTWNVKLKRNGSSFWSGQRTTQEPSGSFEARRVVAGASGDRFAGIATNPRTGEGCRGTATYSA